MNIEWVGGKNLNYTSLNNYSIHHYTNFMNLKLKLYFATLIAIIILVSFCGTKNSLFSMTSKFCKAYLHCLHLHELCFIPFT